MTQGGTERLHLKGRPLLLPEKRDVLREDPDGLPALAASIGAALSLAGVRGRLREWAGNVVERLTGRVKKEHAGRDARAPRELGWGEALRAWSRGRSTRT